jgi:ribokinase
MTPDHAPHVVIVGSLNMDLIATARSIPMPGETVLGTTYTNLHGGKGANQAVAAARAGAQVTMIGRIGNDEFGTALRNQLESEHINVEWVRPCQHDPSGVALITVAGSGENAIVVVPGANALLRTVHVDDAIAAGAFQASRVLLAQLETPVSVVAHAIAEAHERDMRVVLNPAPVTALPDELWPHVDVLVVNEHEVEQLGGIELLRTLVPNIVNTLGGDGIVVYRPGHDPEVIAALEVPVVDTTGAGDAFCGVLAAELAAGRDVLGAAAIANVAAGLSVTQRGARTSPTASEVAAHIG